MGRSTVTPVTLGGIATVAGGALMLAVGVAIARPTVRTLARRVARQQVELVRYRRLARRHLLDLEDAEVRVALLEEDVAELREAVPKVWDAGVAAARQLCSHHHGPEDGVEVWELPAEVVERARANAIWRRN